MIPRLKLLFTIIAHHKSWSFRLSKPLVVSRSFVIRNHFRVIPGGSVLLLPAPETHVRESRDLDLMIQSTAQEESCKDLLARVTILFEALNSETSSGRSSPLIISLGETQGAPGR